MNAETAHADPTAPYDELMSTLRIVWAAVGILAFPAVGQEGEPQEGGAAWSSWRGPLGTGYAPGANPPVSWGPTTNLRWSIPLPGSGQSTPVVHAGRLFVTTATAVGEALEPRPETAPGAHDNVLVTHEHEFAAMAVRMSDGELLWTTVLGTELPHEGGHSSATYAAASPSVDADRLIVSFGSRGLFGLDHDGRVWWKVDLGDQATKHGHGEGASPLLCGDSVVVNWDHEGPSFLVALDKFTGEERWRAERDEVTSWATPIAIEVDGKTQVVVSGTERIRGYDLETGAVVWSCGGLSHNVVASPVFEAGVLYAGSSYEKQALIALRLSGARGELSGTEHMLWYRRRGTPYVPSPVLVDQTLYVLRHYQGVLGRIAIRDGSDIGRPFRIPGVDDVYGSPVAAAGRLYVTDLDGTTAVLAIDSGAPRVLAVNQLDDVFGASAVLVGRDLILRGEDYLYCLSEESEESGSSSR